MQQAAIWEQMDGRECRIYTRTDQTELPMIAEPSVSIAAREVKGHPIMAIRDAFTWPATSVADEVQERKLMLLRDSTGVRTDLFAKSRDMVELHGGSLVQVKERIARKQGVR